MQSPPPLESDARAGAFAQRNSKANLEKLAKEFFSLIDMSKVPRAVRAATDQGDCEGALNAYRDFFMERLATLGADEKTNPGIRPRQPPFPFEKAYVHTAEDLMNNTAVFGMIEMPLPPEAKTSQDYYDICNKNENQVKKGNVRIVFGLPGRANWTWQPEPFVPLGFPHLPFDKSFMSCAVGRPHFFTPLLVKYIETKDARYWEKWLPEFKGSDYCIREMVRTVESLPMLSLMVVPSGAQTPWTGADIRIRREFTLDTAKLYEPWIVLRREGDATVSLNGVRVAERRGIPGGFELVPCANGVVGRNVLAAEGRTEAGKGRLVVGILDLLPQRDMRLPLGIKPILDTWMRDPCVCVGPDGIYYLVGTGTTAAWKCDGIPLYKSADLKTWELVKVVVWRDQFRDTWLLRDRKNVSLWAPELHYLKGNYWLTFCTDWAREGGVSGTGFLKSTTGRVEGPYELVNTDGPITPGELDASFFQDDDGTVYFLSGGSSIARMKADMSGIAEKVRRVGAEGGGTVGFEGISLFKRNGTYYLSVTDCKMPYKTYDCMVGMSDNVYGPYKNVHIAVPHGGHNVFFKDKEGNWWSTLFGGDTPEVAGPLKEQPSILRVEFASDGTIHPLDPRLK